VDASSYLGHEVQVGDHLFSVDEDMVSGVQLFLDTVRTDAAELRGRIISEHTFHLPEVHETAFGSTDACVLQPMGRLVVYDFKYGIAPVSAEDNEQLKFYALGALAMPEAFLAEEVELVIVQPRALGEKVKRWMTTPDHLRAFVGYLHDKALEAEAGGTLVAGDHCEHCRVGEASACPKVREAAVSACTELLPFSPVEPGPVTAPPAPSYLSQDQIERVLELEPMIVEWLGAVKAAARAQLERGDSNAPRNFKLVAGRESNRKWADEKLLVDSGIPADILFERSIRSPAQMEKALKAAKLAFDITSYLAPRTRGTSMVPITDPRPAIQQAVSFTPVSPFTE
jgi:hypothetical protein